MKLNAGAYLVLGLIGLLLVVLAVCLLHDLVKLVIKAVKHER
jgi:hypothetical protein